MQGTGRAVGKQQVVAASKVRLLNPTSCKVDDHALPPPPPPSSSYVLRTGGVMITAAGFTTDFEPVQVYYCCFTVQFFPTARRHSCVTCDARRLLLLSHLLSHSWTDFTVKLYKQDSKVNPVEKAHFSNHFQVSNLSIGFQTQEGAARIFLVQHRPIVNGGRQKRTRRPSASEPFAQAAAQFFRLVLCSSKRSSRNQPCLFSSRAAAWGGLRVHMLNSLHARVYAHNARGCMGAFI